MLAIAFSFDESGGPSVADLQKRSTVKARRLGAYPRAFQALVCWTSLVCWHAL